MFSVILEEIQRTSCQPREVCVEVTKEYPESTSQFYLPRCVALHRCGGCCNNEAYYCANTSHALVNKTVSGAAGCSSFLLVGTLFVSMSDAFEHVNYSTLPHITRLRWYFLLSHLELPQRRGQKPICSFM